MELKKAQEARTRLMQSYLHPEFDSFIVLWSYPACCITTTLQDVDIKCCVNTITVQSQWILPDPCAGQSDDVTWSRSNLRDCCVCASFRDFCCLFCFVFFWGPSGHFLLHPPARLTPSSQPAKPPLLGMCGVMHVREERTCGRNNSQTSQLQTKSWCIDGMLGLWQS